MKPKFFVAIAAAVLLVACPGPRKEDYSQAGPSKASKSTTDAQASPENSNVTNPVNPPSKDIPAARPAVANRIVDVQLTEYRIVMPDTLQAGTMTLNISNAGKEDHSFAVDANGYHAELPEPLKRGDRHSLDVTLKPGTYNVWCPVDEHKGKGMAKTVTVQ